MAFTPVNDGDLAVAPHVQQIIDALQGVPGAGQPISLTSLDSDDTHALTVANIGTGGLAVLVESSGGVTLLDVRDAYASFDSGVLHVDHTNNRVGINDTTPSVALDVTGAITATGAITGGSFVSTGAVTIPDGAVGAPGLAGTGSNADSGLYFAATDQLAVTTAGSQRALFNSSGLGVTGTVTGSTGLVATAGGATITAGGLTVTAGGATITAGGLTLADNQILVPVDASSGASDPEYSFTGDTNTGMYSSAADTLHLVTGGNTRLTVDSAGLTTLANGLTVSGTVTLPSGVALTSPALTTPTISNINAAGDILIGTANDTPGILSLGTKGDVLLAGATAPEYGRFARRNRLINGDMRIKQRVTMPTADDNYCLDRWILLLEAANAATVDQETSDVPTDGSKRALKLTVGSGNNNKFGVVQILEFFDCADLRGKTVSLQFKMKSTAGITNVRAAVIEWTSTADSVTSDVVGTWGAENTNPTLASNWAYCSGYTPVSLAATTSWVTYKIEGVSVGASANNLGVLIWVDDETTTQTTDVLRITDVQLEEGSICTSVERRPFGLELEHCRRYLYVMVAGNQHYLFGMGQAYSTSEAVVMIPLPTRPRTTGPSLSVSSASDFALSTSMFGLATSPTSIILYSLIDNTLAVQVLGGGASLVAGNMTMLLSDTGATPHLIVDAEL